ncbi:Monocarboxylate transporter 12 [Stylophora pistillata]|uniref:Monocarboxylate transporter 12 n=1 Tax=Stylophora pistillata TaxID=50429 RepID=A0A2B4S4C8_STYPI|nr:Monocarboxylate transporter 12 [Stylophora pistillata]
MAQIGPNANKTVTGHILCVLAPLSARRRRPFATGILTSASGLGLFAFAPLTQALLDRFGLKSTLRFLGGTVFATGIPALAYDPNVQENESNDAAIQMQEEKFNERTKPKMVDCSLWRVPTFTVFALAFVLDRFGQSPTRTHLVNYAEERGLSAGNSSRLLMYFGLTSSFIADEFHSYKPAFYLVSSILLACAALPCLIFCLKVNRQDEAEPQTIIPLENHGQTQYVSSC